MIGPQETLRPESQGKSAPGNPLFLLATIVYAAGLALFIYKYVPLVPSFLLAVGPFLAALLILTASRTDWGLVFFVFVFPLINNLPYFFRIDEHIPHAPTALLLFLFFFLGWLLRRSLAPSEWRAGHPLLQPFRWLGAVLLLSALITFLRLSLFFPFVSDAVRDLVVNVIDVRAGGAIMSLVFNFLNYGTGLFFFAIAYRTLKSPADICRVLTALSLSTILSLVFALVQKFVSPGLGNTNYWLALHQFNGTFKDPNAFGAFLASFLPLFLALAFRQRRIRRVLYLAPFFLGLAIFPLIGSRTALLALSVALCVFYGLVIFGQKKYSRKVFASVTIVLVLALLLSGTLSLIGPGGTLVQRFRSDLRLLSQKVSLEDIISQKPKLWRVAAAMVRDYPISGVGLGSYIIELPNYSRRMNMISNLGYTDSAENYLIQASAELGLVGFLLFGGIFFAVCRQMAKTIKACRHGSTEPFLAAGVIAGLVAFFVNGLFHSYIGSFETDYSFWLLAALLFHQAHPEEEDPEIRPASRRWQKWLGVVFISAFGLSHLYNSLHSLSITAASETYGWRQDFGFFKEEVDSQGIHFRWAKKRAGLEVPVLGSRLVLPFAAPPQPDLSTNPLPIRVYLADRYFRKKELIQEFEVSSADWQEFQYSFPSSPVKNSYFLFEASRDWQPLKSGQSTDPRWLGLKLADYWFLYPSSPPGEFETVHAVSRDLWQGGQKNVLSSAGESAIPFRSEGGPLWLGLWLRGDPAFGMGPIIIVRIDQTVAAKAMLSEKRWMRFVFPASVIQGDHILSVKFVNDFSRLDLGQDRNVELGELEIYRQKTLLRTNR